MAAWLGNWEDRGRMQIIPNFECAGMKRARPVAQALGHPQSGAEYLGSDLLKIYSHIDGIKWLGFDKGASARLPTVARPNRLPPSHLQSRAGGGRDGSAGDRVRADELGVKSSTKQVKHECHIPQSEMLNQAILRGLADNPSSPGKAYGCTIYERWRAFWEGEQGAGRQGGHLALGTRGVRSVRSYD